MITLWELPEGATFRFTENEADSLHEVIEHKQYLDSKKQVRVQCLETGKYSLHQADTKVYEFVPSAFDPTDVLDIDEEEDYV